MNDESIVFSSAPPTASADDPTLELGRVLARLRANNGIEMSVKVAMDFLQAQFDRCPLIWLGLYDRRTHQIAGKGGVLPTDNRRALRHSFGLKPGDTLERVVIQQEPFAIANLQREPNAGDWSEAAREAGIRSAIVWPIACRNQCLGVVVLGSNRTGLTLDRHEATQLTIVLGELGNVLYLRELETLRDEARQPHAVMLAVAEHLQGAEPFGQRVARVAVEIQNFLKPTRTRLFWIDRDRGLFVGHDLALALEQQGVPNWIDGDRNVLLSPDLLLVANAQGLPIAEFAGFHDRLLENQPVAIGEAYSSLPSADTGRLMERLDTRSLLAAPLWHHDDAGNHLLGFLAAEAKTARIWTRDEQNFLHGVSRNIAIAAAGYRLSVRHRLLNECHTAALDLVRLGEKRSQHGDAAIEIAERLCVGLELEDVAVLCLDPSTEIYSVVHQRSRGAALPETLPALGSLDEQILANGTQAIALCDIARSTGRDAGRDVDVRLSAWQPSFVAAGWHAVAVSSTALSVLPELAIAIGSAHPRDWSERDLFLLQWAARQLLARRDRQRLAQQQDRVRRAIDAISQGLVGLQSPQSLDAAERQILQEIRGLLDPECIALMHLTPDRERAIVAASLRSADSEVALATDATIDLRGEPLWERSLEATGFVGPLAIATLPARSRPWLGTAAHGQLYALALRSDPESEPSAMFLAIDRGEPWDETLLASVQVLLEALFQAGRVARLTQQLHDKRNALEPLSWYKHRQIESLYWTLGSAGRQIERLVNQIEIIDSNDGHDPNIAAEADRERLFGQQTLRVLGENLSALKAHLQREQWQLHFAPGDISLVTLLKHVLDRSNALLEKRQLWLQVHREGNAIVRGDRKKLELVFYELLTWACQRSTVGGRLDIWYRPLELGTVPATTVLELTITDSGTIDPRLVAVFQRCIVDRGGHSAASLSAPELERAPGIHLAVYHALMKAMDGHFYLELLDDGRTATRLLMPLAESEQTRVQVATQTAEPSVIADRPPA